MYGVTLVIKLELSGDDCTVLTPGALPARLTHTPGLLIAHTAVAALGRTHRLLDSPCRMKQRDGWSWRETETKRERERKKDTEKQRHTERQTQRHRDSEEAQRERQ